MERQGQRLKEVARASEKIFKSKIMKSINLYILVCLVGSLLVISYLMDRNYCETNGTDYYHQCNE